MVAAPKINPDSPLNAGLIAWYLAHPAYFGGTTWPDLSGNGHDGSFVGLTADDWSEDGVGGAKGSLEYVETGISSKHVSVGEIVPASSPVNQLTMIAWLNRSGINPLAVGGYEGIVFSRAGTVTGMNIRASVELGYLWNGGHFNYSSGVACPVGVDLMCAVAISPTGAYFAVFDPSGLIGDDLRVGVSHGSTYLQSVMLGADPVQRRYILGQLSDARIYNRALSPAEIAAYYAESLGGYKTVLKRSGPLLSSPHLINHLDSSQPFRSPHLIGSLQ